MKKVLLLVVSLLMIGAQVNAQSKASADAQKALEKAQADSQHAKKSTLPATWVKLGQAYINCFDAPSEGILPGTSQMEVKLFLKDQQILSTSQENKGGRNYTVDTYADKALYYDENGILAAWLVTKPVVEDALGNAYESMKKAAELDAKGSQAKVINESMINIKNRYYDEAIYNYTLGNNSVASVGFEKAWEVAAHPAIGQVDSTMAYYAALTAMMAGEQDRAIKFFEYCLSINFEQDGDTYANLSDNYKQKGDTVKCKEILTTAFAKYPNSQSVLVALINVYMESNDDPEKILEILKVAQNNEPNNASLIYAEGSLHNKLQNFEAAIACYKRAAEVDPNYIYAPFAEGTTYYDWAVAIQGEAEKELDDTKYMALVEKMDKTLQDAIAPFERAFNIAQDADIKLACAEYLKNIYFRFRDKEASFQENYDKFNKYVEENK